MKFLKGLLKFFVFICAFLTLFGLGGITFGDKVIEFVLWIVIVLIPSVLICNPFKVRSKLPLFKSESFVQSFIGIVIIAFIIGVAQTQLSKYYSPEFKANEQLQLQAKQAEKEQQEKIKKDKKDQEELATAAQVKEDTIKKADEEKAKQEAEDKKKADKKLKQEEKDKKKQEEDAKKKADAEAKEKSSQEAKKKDDEEAKNLATQKWNTKEVDVMENGNMQIASKVLAFYDSNALKGLSENANLNLVIKAPWRYYGKVFNISGEVASILDYAAGSKGSKNVANGEECSEIHVVTDSGVAAGFILIGNSGNIQVGSYVTLYGVPVGTYQNKNKLGGTITELLFVGK